MVRANVLKASNELQKTWHIASINKNNSLCQTSVIIVYYYRQSFLARFTAAMVESSRIS